MIDELLCNVLLSKNAKKSWNKFEFSHGNVVLVVSLTLIIMEITFLPFPWIFRYHE